MATYRTITRTLAVALLGASLAACSSGPATQPPGSSGAGQLPGAATPAGSGAPVGSQGSSGAGSGGAGQTADICALFTAAEIGSFLGRSATQGGTAAGEAQSCRWDGDDLTSVYLYRTDTSECDDTKASVTGGPVTGADFAGPNAGLGAMFAGVVKGGACYVVEVAPTEKSPQPDALVQLLQTFVQRAGA